MNRLFGDDTNLNGSIMVIPSEQGGSEEDHYMASIGDAATKHIRSLSDSGRQVWDTTVHIPGVGLFMPEENVFGLERDPKGLKWRDLEAYVDELLARYNGVGTDDDSLHLPSKLSQHEFQDMMGEVAEEITRREEEKESAEFGAVEMVSFEAWEKFPSLWKHVDLPATPPDHMRYLGDADVQFYDSFPEDHPDSAIIRSVLQILNRRWEDIIDEDYAEFAKNWLIAHTPGYIQTEVTDPRTGKKRLTMAPMGPKFACLHTKDLLLQMVDALEADENEYYLDDIIEAHLVRIDQEWKEEYRRVTQKKFRKVWDPRKINEFGNTGDYVDYHNVPDAMDHMLSELEVQWTEQDKKGFIIFPEVKKMGSILFTEFREKMESKHWKTYRGLKKKFAPKVILNGVDINRANVTELDSALGSSARLLEETPMDRMTPVLPGDEVYLLWTGRGTNPYLSLSDAYSRKLLKVQHFAENEEGRRIVKFLEDKAHQSIRERKPGHLFDLRDKLMKSQESGTKVLLSSEQWRQVWVAYSLLRETVATSLRF